MSRRPLAVCTYFDANYLSRGIVMLGTLLSHDPAANAYVLCFDAETERVLNAWFPARVHAVPLASVHAFDPRLPALAFGRSRWAFYATHKAAFAHYVMATLGPVEWVAFVDADTAFYGSLSPVIDELQDASIGISPHRFVDPNDPRAMFGVYNAGFICFRDDATGRQCLGDWREDCVAWCEHHVMPDGRYMNQGYLNRWPDRYANVALIRHPGANLAPWNVGGHRLDVRDGRSIVDGVPLIFFHFASLTRDADGSWRSGYAQDLERHPDLIETLYRPYVHAVEDVRRRLIATQGISGTGSVRETP